ncbi:MAG: MBL fold metallo-hydrolase [Ilumatobacteraceae bacterium]|nr:MBL fold metallo-hydrolase [Ilumatobacteraceae bacterium]
MTGPEFRSLDDVTYGAVEQVSPLIRRVIAENPSKFTYQGTGTYIVGHGDVVVIDPGPLLDSHRDALAAALDGERVRAILITHCHADHSPLAAWLRAESGAPTIAFGPHPRPEPGTEPIETTADETTADETTDDETTDGSTDGVETEETTDYDFEPDTVAGDGDVVVDEGGLRMRAVHTPGHTSNHMCWTLDAERALFTGDHIMGWSTTVVSPPDGDMTAYLDSLRCVAGRDDAVLWPTHGPPRDDARSYVNALIEHRLDRERGVLEAVRAGRSTIPEMVALLYADVREELHKPAGRSVWAHLERLVANGSVEVEGMGPPRLDADYRAV